MTTCFTCGAETDSTTHICADPLDGFDEDRDAFEPVRDEKIAVDDLTRKRWEKAQSGGGPDLMDPDALH